MGMFPADTSLAPGAKSAKAAAVVGSTGQEGQALAVVNARRHRWIAKNGRQQRELVRWGYKRMADLRVSTTDHDASPMHQKKKSASRLGYLTHYVVDGGKARVILEIRWSRAPRLQRTSPCWRCSSGAVFDGACTPARSRGTPPTERRRT
jgi:hypothetical protein